MWTADGRSSVRIPLAAVLWQMINGMASLYSHFGSKQEILDNVVESVLTGYAEHSIFANADWDDPEFTKDKEGMTAEDAAKMIQGQVRYILHDPAREKEVMDLVHKHVLQFFRVYAK